VGRHNEIDKEHSMAEREVTTALISKQEEDGVARKRGLLIKRLFSRPGVNPFDELEWELRTASIQNEKG
jgi:ribonucleoside-diphosphate reductase alpha chain